MLTFWRLWQSGGFGASGRLPSEVEGEAAIMLDALQVMDDAWAELQPDRDK